MKKSLLVLTMVIGLSVMVVGNVQAALIGVNLSLPDILSDSVGTYSYNATTDLFTATATALTITFDGVTLIPITGSASYFANFYVDGAGNFSGNAVGDDLTITGNIDADGDSVNDYTGVLLTGEITDFGWLNIPPTSIDAFDYSFAVTGGALAGFYGALGGGDVMTTEISTFAGSFLSNFSGTKAKHDTAPVVPEPASMALLGIGVLGLFGLRRKA